MVFKPFTHLARQSLGKTFTHGYAQSVVAATQSSYASSTTPFGPFTTARYSKNGTSQLHTAFQHPSTPSAFNASNGHHAAGLESSPPDGGLTAYYEAWQKQQLNNSNVKEWKQFQFPLRIGWKAPGVLPEGKSANKDSSRLRSDTIVERGGLDRAYSTSAVDDIKRVEDDVAKVAAEAAAVAKVDEDIAREISTSQISPAQTIISSTSGDDLSTGISSNISSSSVVPSKPVAPSQPLLSSTADAVRKTDSQLWSEEVVKLHGLERYAEIPAVFESMLASGIVPSVEAYNALLAAAIKLPAAKHHVVSKALGVYTSMLRQKVSPDSAFYTTLLGLLSQRAIDVYHKKTAMDIKRLRFGSLKAGSSFLLRSDEAEYAILSEDDALTTAIRIFNTAVAPKGAPLLSSQSYQSLITACAVNGRVEDMIQIYSNLESSGVVPMASIFPAMIEAFARPGDLRSAVECYNEYKAMAVRENAGHAALLDRNDNEVYAAVVKSYALCDRDQGSRRFFGKVLNSLKEAASQNKDQPQDVQNSITADGLIEHRLDAARYRDALEIAEEQNMTPPARSRVMARICCAAADNNDTESAMQAYRSIDTGMNGISDAALSMLALHIRHGQFEEAGSYWAVLNENHKSGSSLIEPTTLYTAALIEHGDVDMGVTQARQAFARMRASAITTGARDQIKDEIDEVIELMGPLIAAREISTTPETSMNLLWTMSENNGPVSPLCERLLAGLGPEEISSLSHEDMVLVLRIEADMISGGAVLQDVAHMARFEHLLGLVIHRDFPLDTTTTALIEQSLVAIGSQRPDILGKWRQAQQIERQPFTPASISPLSKPTAATPSLYPDSFDPYAPTMDQRGSNIIVDELDSTRSRHSTSLDEALLRFRNMRRVGRHPRYIVYAKLITAAAKEGRVNLLHDLLSMARQDVPFLPQYSSVREGWSSILDSMIGACLTVGNRSAASDFHQELLGIGSAPTANTFGLYITTLKESTRTFDEATEAVNIFRRAKVEGVEPSAFLYNALIGKLGKARRIDDCLFYFTEMRASGIRPTSVTYGTIVNALCRVSDERHAEELFDEMESMPNYKPRPAPYNSLMQFFLTTKRDSQKVLEYYSRMLSKNITPTMHTYKLLIDTYATLEPVNMPAAEGVLNAIRASGQRPEAVHYASLVHAKGCALHDMAGARETFDAAMANPEVRPQACLYQALFEAMVANHCIEETESLLEHMAARRVEMTPYIANTLIHGWATAQNVAKAQSLYEQVGIEKREPSTYEAMTRAFLTSQGREQALGVVHEMLSRGYPSAVTSKIVDLLGHHGSRAASVAPIVSPV
ncbi:MAG: hypothetical protein Q9220_005404 [cf. Caloplaca sp. 1 TL-2023]